MNFFFTSESVSDGHPDKICDQISDIILDCCLKKDPYAKVAVEVMATLNRIVISGECSLNAVFSFDELRFLIRNFLKKLGCEHEGFHWETVVIDIYLQEQSPDIRQGIGENGAGDQGIIFGYACSETSELMPAPIFYAHKILKILKEKRLTNQQLGADAKCQVTLNYINYIPSSVHTVIVSSQHHPDIEWSDFESLLFSCIEEAIPKEWMTPDTKIYINPAGRFVLGGPVADTGVTGRKIVVDTYGGSAPHGGGCFSGKDFTKVDRSAAYMLRYIAKNVVHLGLCRSFLIQVAYAIGMKDPVACYVQVSEDSLVSCHDFVKIITQSFDLSPLGIARFLGLNQPIYERTASYGHFGRVAEGSFFSWEKKDPDFGRFFKI